MKVVEVELGEVELGEVKSGEVELDEVGLGNHSNLIGTPCNLIRGVVSCKK